MGALTLRGSPVRVLSLDGGGVRGLSSLIILETVLTKINEHLSEHYGAENHVQLHLTDVFDHVIGTSTGGLIAIMIVKLAMPILDCISNFKDLARRMFARKQFGSYLGGLGRPRYSGHVFAECVKGLIHQYGHRKNGELIRYMEEENIDGNKTSCIVVCREYTTSGRRLSNPSFLCSHNCRPGQTLTPGQDLIETWEAARATAAAPTFFPKVIIKGRTFVDGAFGHTNNPSRKAHFHLLAKNPGYHRSPVIWLNIGTGSLVQHDTDSRRGSVVTRVERRLRDKLMPTALREARALLQDLGSIATNADKVEDEMEDIISTKSNDQRILFQRVSANNGVAEIQLDDWRGLERIEELTRMYLAEPAVESKTDKLAKQLARAIIARKDAQADLVQLRTVTLERKPSVNPPLRRPRNSFKASPNGDSLDRQHEAASRTPALQTRTKRKVQSLVLPDKRDTGRRNAEILEPVGKYSERVEELLSSLDVDQSISDTSESVSPEPPPLTKLSTNTNPEMGVSSLSTEKTSADLIAAFSALPGMTVPNLVNEKRFSNVSVGDMVETDRAMKRRTAAF